MFVGGSTYILMNLYISWWRPKIVRYLLQYLACSLPSFLKQVLMSLELTEPTRLSGPASELQGPACLWLLSTGTASVCCQTQLCLWMLTIQTQVLLLSSKQLSIKYSPRLARNTLLQTYSLVYEQNNSLRNSTENSWQNHHYGSSLWLSQMPYQMLSGWKFGLNCACLPNQTWESKPEHTLQVRPM